MMVSANDANGTKQLPLVLSVPHGGSVCPPDLVGRSILGERDLFDDSDALTDRIYDLRGHVAHISIARVARAYLDLNRAPDDLPPANPDGVVKLTTDHEVPIYSSGHELTLEDASRLIAEYHAPYHEKLSRDAAVPGIIAGLDCHSMEPYPPAIAPDADAPRPLFCLSNGEGVTAPDSMLLSLRYALAVAFGIQEESIALNEPFKGGFIVRSHAQSDPVPWIQVEMNRKLYLSEPWFEESRLIVVEERIAELRTRFAEALRVFASSLA